MDFGGSVEFGGGVSVPNIGFMSFDLGDSCVAVFGGVGSSIDTGVGYPTTVSISSETIVFLD